MRAGFLYIMRHPLLPGLYALDWGMSLSTFYRELFPFLVARLWVDGRLGLSARAAAAALTMANYAGGMVGSAVTLAFASYPHKGRGVCIATLAYGACASAMGCSSALALGLVSVAACGATDAVGVTMRKTVVLLTTPDAMRGRASAGHSLAASSANAIGLLYVAAMGSAIGPGPTFVLGGVLTWAAVGLAVYRIPTIWTHTDDTATSSSTGLPPSGRGPRMSVGSPRAGELPTAACNASMASAPAGGDAPLEDQQPPAAAKPRGGQPRARLLDDDGALNMES